jgi:hypothetical protein
VTEKSEAICKEMPVIPVNRVVDKNMEGRGGGEAQGVADTKNTKNFTTKTT